MTLSIATLEKTLVAQTPPLTLAEGEQVWRVTGTRVPLDTIVHAYQDGATAEEIVSAYPSLRLPDVYSVLAYYLQNSKMVEAYLAEREKHANSIRLKSCN